MRASQALGAAFAGMAAMVIGAAAIAQQQWPARSIMVVSPFFAGTTNDLIANLVLGFVGRKFGQPFVIENRPRAAAVQSASPRWCMRCPTATLCC
jgi:tripartite-type tricarboxylate transporter receptor subunit TctC